MCGAVYPLHHMSLHDARNRYGTALPLPYTVLVGCGQILALLTLGSRVDLQELIVIRLVKKFHTFYETQRFFTVFTKALS
jgi:hypothetical protein